MTSDTASVAHAAGSDAGAVGGRPEPRVPHEVPGRRPVPALAGLILAGGLVAGALAGAALSSTPSYEIGQVELNDLDAAATSIPPAEAGTLIADAKACRVPMAVVTLRPHPGQTGIVRIRSGDYWSPSIRLGTDPLRVAIPWPAPYPTARGDLAFESAGVTYDVFLRPGWVSAGRPGLSIVHVWWTPRSSC